VLDNDSDVEEQEGYCVGAHVANSDTVSDAQGADTYATVLR